MVKTVHPVTFDKFASVTVDKDFRCKPPAEDIPEGEATSLPFTLTDLTSDETETAIPEYTLEEGVGMADNDGLPGDNDEAAVEPLTGKP